MRRALLVTCLLFGAVAGCTSNYKKREANIHAAIQETNNLAEVLENVKDRESARALAPRIAALVQTLDNLKTQDNALPQLSKKDEDRLANAYRLAMENAHRRMVMALMGAQKKADGEPSFVEAMKKMQALNEKFGGP
jgi:hypothetical protein